MNFNYYIFDLDNCLIKLTSNYFNNILIESLKLLNSDIIPNNSEIVRFWSAGEDYHLVLQEWGVNQPEQFWNIFDDIDFKNRKKLIKQQKIKLFDDVLHVLTKLKTNKKKICLVSNTSDAIINYILKQFELEGYFHKFFGMGPNKDERLAKPSPQGIKKVLIDLNYDFNNSQEAIMVGDSHVDIFAAKQANIHGCLIKREENRYPDGFENWDYKPDSVIDNLTEIFTL
ncbi:MAG: HAD family hydrolase [Promethearchaeia archaeon]